MNVTSAATPLPLVAGRYRLLEKLGEGRLAAVYHATDESLQRSVLVHVLRQGLAGQEALRQRFVTEVNASARRSHPALLEVFDSGEMDGCPFVVTDYVTGHPLRGRGLLTPEHALLYMRQIAGAVALCQTRGLPYPPISSSNVLLVDDGQVKLVENWLVPPGEMPFDLAHYRAPELSEGLPPGPANAVYALGLLLYELLTGSRPVRGQDAVEVARAHLTMTLPPLARTHPRLYLPTLDDLLRRATARSPQQRFPDAASFAEALNVAWRDVTTDTQQLALVPPLPAQSSGITSILSRPQPVPATSATAGVAPQAQPTGTSSDGFVDPARLQQHPLVRAVGGWLVMVLLLLAVAWGSYVGASFLANRLFAIDLPQISIPQLGLPQINLPSIALPIPDWISGVEQGEMLIVSITEGLNLRDQPGLTSNVIAVVPNGTRVRKLEGPRVIDDVPWVRIRVEQEGVEPLEGWMSLNFLKAE